MAAWQLQICRCQGERQVGPHSSHNTGSRGLAHGWSQFKFSRNRKSIFPPSHLPSFSALTASFFPLRPSSTRYRGIHNLCFQTEERKSGFIMSAMRKHNVTTFPRPPVVERTNRHIQIKWHGQLLADCPPGEAFWVLETHHAPGPLPFLDSPSPILPRLGSLPILNRCPSAHHDKKNLVFAM